MMLRFTFVAAMCGLAVALSFPVLADDKDKKKRSHHNPLVFKSVLSGAQETAPVDSDASAKLVVRFDPGLSKMHVRLKVRGVNSMVVAGHFHCGRAGANGPVAFGLMSPGPVTEIGELTRVTLTNADAVGADCMPVIGQPVNNIASLYFAMREGLIYLNLHTPDFPPGELRGQLMQLH